MINIYYTTYSMLLQQFFQIILLTLIKTAEYTANKQQGGNTYEDFCYTSAVVYFHAAQKNIGTRAKKMKMSPRVSLTRGDILIHG